MARRVVRCAPSVVRALLARAALELEGGPLTLGSIRLHEHQRSAIVRIRKSLHDTRGAVLADAVGLGKTYVGLGVAHDYANPLVIAPAVLRSAWLDAAERADVPISFVSTESLSRRPPGHQPDLVVVDEAHHFRNAGTRRYARLARLVRSTPVLLISATPVHNRHAELCALLALYLGSAAASLPDTEVATHVLRREHRDVPQVRLPRLRSASRIEIAADAAVLDRILALPSAVPLRDGGTATTLVRLGLAHAWTSSDAAFLAYSGRRIARGLAIRDALSLGRIPSRQELGAWAADETSVQLGFTELLVEAGSMADQSAAALLDGHLTALRELRECVRGSSSRDSCRLAALHALLRTHRNERIVAFSAYADTVHAFFRELSQLGGVGAVTGSGGRLASGRHSAEDVLRTFRYPRHERERIALLLATDLLSEGINLPEATVVVHLDLPWTPARLEQRTGRLRRVGSAAPEIRSYVLTQPPVVERRLRKELLLERKARLAATMVGWNTAHADGHTPLSAVRALQLVRQTADRWRGATGDAPSPPAIPARIAAAAVRSERCGFLALVRSTQGLQLLGGLFETAAELTPSSDPRQLLELMRHGEGEPTPIRAAHYRSARRAVARALSASRLRSTLRMQSPQYARRLLQRLETAIADSPPHRRTAIAKRVSHLRSSLAQRLPIAVERELLRATAKSRNIDELIAAAEIVLSQVSVQPAASPYQLLALLLLVPPQRRA